MADYYASSRSNYFKIKDNTAFMKALEPVADEITVETRDDGRVCLLAEDQFGTFPTCYWDKQNDKDVEFEIEKLVAAHLADGEVAVFISVGAEKLRYVQGSAVAINNKGERRSVDLDRIYELAKDLGSEITDAAY